MFDLHPSRLKPYSPQGEREPPHAPPYEGGDSYQSKIYFMLIQIRFLLLSLIAFSMIACSEPNETTSEELEPTKVKTGAEMLIENHLDELQGQRVGLVMNPTARIGDTHMLDTLMALDVNVSALFAPEHGFRGEAGAGEKIEDGVDQETGLPVYSLYGDTRKPTQEMLEEVDLLIFDMQDVGARFYTYNATMGLVIEAAADAGVPLWILDRPNPAGGDYVSGWLMEDEYQSFVGAYPIPVAHGMTLGELGGMMIEEGWLELRSIPTYRVIKMEGWTHNMLWDDTGLEWIPPSPNLPEFENAHAYLGTAFFEGTTLSEGRGTFSPFLILGDPHFNYHDSTMQALATTYGVHIDSITFTPKKIPGKAPNPDHEGQFCYGIEISIPDPQQFTDPVAFGLDLMSTMLKATPEADTLSFLYKLAGTKEKITRFLDQSLNIGQPSELWQEEMIQFKKKREPYLLYP